MHSISCSFNDVPISLTDERWRDIVENHDDMASYYDKVLQTVEDADYVIRGYEGAFIALQEFKKMKYLAKEEIVWRKKS